MLDIATELYEWLEQGRSFAVATVVAVSGSAPRQAGAALAVESEGAAIGSVSGGCVEGAVYELCMGALQDGRTVLERFGYSDEDAFAVGLTCGGTVDILISPVTADAPGRRTLAAALHAAAAGEAVAVARVAEGPEGLRGRAVLARPDGSSDGSFGAGPELDRTAAAEALGMLKAGRTGRVVVDDTGSSCGQRLALLIESSVPPPRMIVFGAVDFAAALVRMGKFLGYHVTVCDARSVFATEARFPDADEIVVEWPHRYLESTYTDGQTVLCALTHDARFDVPLLARALRLPVAFVGAMGSRRSHEDRNRRLREAGVTDHELTRLHSPIGLDLGGRTPEETALSIAAEIVAARRGGSGVSLKNSHRPIHHDTDMGEHDEECRFDAAEAKPGEGLHQG